MTTQKNAFKQIAITAARAGDSKKAENVRVYDLCNKSTLADFAVLMSVESAPQLEAVEEEVLVKLKHEGVYCLHKDGMRSRNWKVLDYGGTLVHIYDAKAEEFYSLTKVYADYKPVEWEEKAPAPAPQKAAPAAKKAPAAGKAPAAKKPAAKKAVKRTVRKAAPKKAARKTAPKKAGPAKKNAKKK
ncbi:MAG: ribosome silencing factor [Elusimicrobiales bacterium]|nr:ribosome silencing factor [Elusimicrobiales bacterium]